MSFQSRRRILGAIMTCAALSLVPLGATAQTAGNLRTLPPGLHHLQLPRAGEPTVGFAISIPANYSPSTPVPLILALHFGVGGGDAFGAGGDVVEILVGPAFAQLGAIIVAPDSLGGNWSTQANEKAANDLLDMVLSYYAIDKKKIVVTGYSMGGQGAWHFGEKFPQRFSAAIAVEGRPPESAAGWHLPVLAVHSRADQVAPFGPTEARIKELQKAGVNAKLIAVDGISHYETNRFQSILRQAIPWLREVWK